MDAQVRAILSSPTFYPSSTAPTNPALLADEISHFTAALKGAGKITANSATRAGHFAIHLAHLKLGFKFNHAELVKKSSLTAAIYNREFGVCLRYLAGRDEAIITPASVVSFYGLRQDALVLLGCKKDCDPVEFIGTIMAAAASCKASVRVGTVAEVAAIWALDSDSLRTSMTTAKKSLPSADICKTVFSNNTTTETSNNARPKRQSPSKATLTTTPNQHPLRLLSCASIGPAFGPILIK